MSKDMKLIMESFKRAMNEQMGGIGMPLKTGVATAAGKAAKAEEDRRNRVIMHNVRFIRKLRSMGGEPQFIEIEPGDIMGIAHDNLADFLSGYDHKGVPRLFAVNREGNIILTGDVIGRRRDNVPIKVSPRELAAIIRRKLEKKDLYADLYLKRPNTADPDDIPKPGI